MYRHESLTDVHAYLVRLRIMRIMCQRESQLGRLAGLSGRDVRVHSRRMLHLRDCPERPDVTAVIPSYRVTAVVSAVNPAIDESYSHHATTQQ
jgi:hypothetical protein